MKIIIKESQIESFILKYLNNQDLITLDSPNKIYFVKSYVEKKAAAAGKDEKTWLFNPEYFEKL